MNGDLRLSRKARAAMERKNAEICVSTASAIELAMKVRLGKLPKAVLLVHTLAATLSEQGFSHLPVSLEHRRLDGLLPGVHRDPFDPINAAQSLIERISVVTTDLAVAAFGVEIV